MYSGDGVPSGMTDVLPSFRFSRVSPRKGKVDTRAPAPADRGLRQGDNPAIQLAGLQVWRMAHANTCQVPRRRARKRNDTFPGSRGGPSARNVPVEVCGSGIRRFLVKRARPRPRVPCRTGPVIEAREGERGERALAACRCGLADARASNARSARFPHGHVSVRCTFRFSSTSLLGAR